MRKTTAYRKGGGEGGGEGEDAHLSLLEKIDSGARSLSEEFDFVMATCPFYGMRALIGIDAIIRFRKDIMEATV